MNDLKFVNMKMRKVSLDKINLANKNTLIGCLGIRVTELGNDYLIGKMPVDHRTIQPFGLLHGGASVALIESLGSIGSNLIIDDKKEFSVGLEVNANHIGSVKVGFVFAKAKLVHLGKRTHVWIVDVYDELSNKLICSGRLTMMIVEKNNN